MHDVNNAKDVLQRVKDDLPPPPSASKLTISKKNITQKFKQLFFDVDDIRTFAEYDATTADMCLTIITARNKLKEELQSENDRIRAANYKKVYEKKQQQINAILEYLSSGMKVDRDHTKRDEKNKKLQNWHTWPLKQEDALVLANMESVIKARDNAGNNEDVADGHQHRLVNHYFRRMSRFTAARLDAFAKDRIHACSRGKRECDRKIDDVTEKGLVHSDWLKQMILSTNDLVRFPTPLLWYKFEVRPDRFVRGTKSFTYVTDEARSVLKNGGNVRILLVLPYEPTSAQVKAVEQAAACLNDTIAAASPSPDSDHKWARIYVEPFETDSKDQDLLFLYDESHGGECMVQKRYNAALTSGDKPDFYPAAHDIIFEDFHVNKLRKEFEEDWTSAHATVDVSAYTVDDESDAKVDGDAAGSSTWWK